jgi:hypothetical protein
MKTVESDGERRELPHSGAANDKKTRDKKRNNKGDRRLSGHVRMKKVRVVRRADAIDKLINPPWINN